MSSKTRKLVLVVFSVAFTAILLEFALQIWSYFSPQLRYLLARSQVKAVPDSRLGLRPSPTYPEHDRNGFRNPTVPASTCVAVFGDSQTYGHKVQAYQAWPRQMEEVSKIKTYNMAFGGFGPVHSLLLWDEALALKPHIVIEAFYAGNDLYDCYDRVYYSDQASYLKSASAETVAAVMRSGRDFEWSPPTRIGPEEKPERHGSVRAVLANHSKLYGLLRAAKRAYHYRFVQIPGDPYFVEDWKVLTEKAKSNPEFWAFEGIKVKTVFASASRVSGLNTSDIRIAEGFRICLRTLKLLHDRSQVSNIHYFVVLIPTKELVFKQAVLERASDIPDNYKKTIQLEEAARAATVHYLQENSIRYIDCLPALRNALGSGDQPYSMTADGHLNAYGHRIIAQLVLERLKADPTLLKNCPSK